MPRAAARRVVVVDYDSVWPHAFQALRDVLWEVLSDFASAIEHVGSTSVPGLAAKPVIDLDVVVPRPWVAEAIARIETLGYRHEGDQGVPQREAFEAPPGAIAHHLYLCPEGSPALANHLAVRDHLRANRAAAESYGALKKRLAARFPFDRARYGEGKTGFLVTVLEAAGLDPAALDEIEEMNRRAE